MSDFFSVFPPELSMAAMALAGAAPGIGEAQARAVNACESASGASGGGELAGALEELSGRLAQSLSGMQAELESISDNVAAADHDYTTTDQNAMPAGGRGR